MGFTCVSKDGVDDIESTHVLVSPCDGLEGKGNVGFVFVGWDTGFSTEIFRSLTGFQVINFGSWDGAKFVFDEVNEFLVVLNAGGTDVDSSWVDIFELEFLEGVGSKVTNIAFETLQWHTESFQAVGSSEQSIIEFFTGVDVVVQLVGVLIFLLANVSGDNGTWFQSAIGHHTENVHNIVGEARSFPVGGFLIVFHGEISTGHLDHPAIQLQFVRAKSKLLLY